MLDYIFVHEKWQIERYNLRKLSATNDIKYFGASKYSYEL